MIRKIVIAIVCCVAGSVYAQDGTVSPYSYFGIGEFKSVTAVENQAMGGLAVFSDSIHFNLQNPASLSRLRLTTYGGGGSHKMNNLISASESQRVGNTNLDYLSLAFPLAKNLGFGFGVAPFSSVGYNLSRETTNTSDATVTNVFSGSGGLNTVFASVGYQAFKDFSLGATASFAFGTIENQRIQSVENVQLGTVDLKTSRLNGLNFKLAANYTPKISEKYRLHTSVILNTQNDIASENTETVGSFNATTGSDAEVINVDLEALGLKKTTISVPATTTFGIGIGEDKKWFLGAEYSSQALNGFDLGFLAADNLVYQDASKFKVGGFFIPNYSSFSKYFERVTYRAGARFGTTGMIVNNEEISDFGITFGFGLPLPGSFSNVNVAFEYGKTGTTNAGLVEEDYMKLSIGLSLNDRWFQKRKIN